MKINKASNNDLETIRLLENKVYGYYLTDEIINDKMHTILILIDDCFKGYISLWHDDNKAQIESIIVNDENKGYGSNLMDYSIKLMGNYVWSLEVRESNLKAIHLYEKFGFKKVALRRNYYSNGENAILMVSIPVVCQ